MIRAGAGIADVTPPAGLAMAGFAARLPGAAGTHDPLTVRALALEDIVLLVADVIGVDQALCARVAAALDLAPEQLMIAASHTHGGPGSMPGRLGVPSDPGFMAQLEQGCIRAAADARAQRRPVRVSWGMAQEPGFASNRRSKGGPVDRAIPVVRLDTEEGQPLAILAVCACHPVVLGSDNLLWTADYPFYFRRAIERDLPGVLAITATGFCGDVNTGHSAAASLSTAAQELRSYAHAERMGEALARAVLSVPLRPLDGEGVHAAAAEVALPFRAPDQPGADQARAWLREAEDADPIRANILRLWADWAQSREEDPAPYAARVQAFGLGELRLIGLPGEIFAQTALDLRAALDGPAVLIGYAGDNPGYIAPAADHPAGGYEIDEAHRLYGQPEAFAPGSAESLAGAALTLCRHFNQTTLSQHQGEQA